MMKVIVALMAMLAVAMSAPNCPQECQGPACFEETPAGTNSIGVCGERYYGIPERLCQPDGTWHPNTQVFCILYKCAAERFENADYSETTAANAKTGICAEGYHNGSPRRTCSALGVWSTTTTGAPCVAKPRCAATEAGNAEFAETVADNTGVSGTCKAGYAGTPPTMDCDSTGTWVNQVGSGCTRIQCPLSNLANAEWEARDAPLTGAESVVGDCDTGLSGSPTRECNADGTWTGITGGTTCTTSCTATGSYAHATFPDTEAGQVATGTCDPGYASSPAATRKCNDDGTWSSHLSTYCTRNTCAAVDDGVGGASFIKTNSGTYRVGTCSPGFTGRASRLCQLDGNWAPTAYKSCTPL